MWLRGRGAPARRCRNPASSGDPVQMMVRGQAFPAEGMDGQVKLDYINTPEDSYYNLAQYYGVPALSFRCAADGVPA